MADAPTTRNRRPIAILTYHQIAPAPPKGTPYRSLVVAPKDFARHMQILHRLGYQGLSMSALMPYLRGEKEGKVFGITFDDGYLNNLEHALPVLQRLGFSSTCYVVSQRMGQTNVWDAEKGIPQVPLMNGAQLQQWIAGGQEAGAHTRHHVHLPAMHAAQCEDEIRGCRAELEQLLGVPVQHFCYPYGEYTPTHIQQLQQSGYLSATTTQPGRAYAASSWWELRRVSVVRRTSRWGLLLKVLTGFKDRQA